MENTSINKKPSYSTYSSVLRGDYLFTRKSKGCLKETFHPLRQTPQLGAILVVGHHRLRRDCLWHSSGVFFYLFIFLKCACVYLCLRAMSPLPCWIIRCVRPVYLWLWWAVWWWWPVCSLADRAVMDHSSHTLATETRRKWLYWSVVMTCDGCCFGHRAHFCLVPAFLYLLVRCSVDSVLCFDDMLAVFGRIIFSFLPPACLFSSHLHWPFCYFLLFLCHVPLL